jgi:Na+/H+ antiporter NhaA
MAASIATVSFILVLSGVALMVENPMLEAIAFGALTGVGFSVGLFLSIVAYFNFGYFLDKRKKAKPQIN